MELFALKYFLAVAKHEHVHRAAAELHVSAAALSKAVTRLEAELGATLFSREGRNIRLTADGRTLAQRAAQLVRLTEQIRLDLGRGRAELRLVLGGPEVLLAHFGVALVADLRARLPNATFHFETLSDEVAIKKAVQGEIHLALVGEEPGAQIAARALGTATFKTCVGPGHKLYARAKRGAKVPIDEALAHPFVMPSLPLYGRLGMAPSADGWRDDVFPRHVAFTTTSLRLLQELVATGQAMAYVPDYLLADMRAVTVDMIGCPFKCVQTIRLVTAEDDGAPWLSALIAAPKLPRPAR